jgi:hypothetical protein
MVATQISFGDDNKGDGNNRCLPEGVAAMVATQIPFGDDNQGDGNKGDDNKA